MIEFVRRLCFGVAMMNSSLNCRRWLALHLFYLYDLIVDFLAPLVSNHVARHPIAFQERKKPHVILIKNIYETLYFK